MSVLDLVQQHLGQSQIQELSQEIGADPAQTQSAIQAALPMLLGGMAQTAQQPAGAGAIAGAMQEHEGLLGGLGGLGGLGAILGGLGGAGGGGLLGKILGGHQPTVENGVQQASGLNSSQVQRLLFMLAPIVLAALARHRQQSASTGGMGGGMGGAMPSGIPSGMSGAASAGSDDANGDGIPDILQQQAQQAREETQRSSPHIGGIIGKILDAATRH